MPDRIIARDPGALMDFNHAVILTVEEAAELAAYMEHQYLNKNKHPALCKLLERLTPKPEARP